MRHRRAESAGPSGLLVLFLVGLAFVQLVPARDAHATFAAARHHGRTRKWRERQIIEVDVNGDGIFDPVATLLGIPEETPFTVSVSSASSTVSPSSTASVSAVMASTASEIVSTSSSPVVASPSSASAVAETSRDAASSAVSSTVQVAPSITSSESRAEPSSTQLEMKSSPSSSVEPSSSQAEEPTSSAVASVSSSTESAESAAPLSKSSSVTSSETSQVASSGELSSVVEPLPTSTSTTEAIAFQTSTSSSEIAPSGEPSSIAMSALSTTSISEEAVQSTSIAQASPSDGITGVSVSFGESSAVSSETIISSISPQPTIAPSPSQAEDNNVPSSAAPSPQTSAEASSFPPASTAIEPVPSAEPTSSSPLSESPQASTTLFPMPSSDVFSSDVAQQSTIVQNDPVSSQVIASSHVHEPQPSSQAIDVPSSSPAGPTTTDYTLQPQPSPSPSAEVSSTAMGPSPEPSPTSSVSVTQGWVPASSAIHEPSSTVLDETSAQRPASSQEVTQPSPSGFTASPSQSTAPPSSFSGLDDHNTITLIGSVSAPDPNGTNVITFSEARSSAPSPTSQWTEPSSQASSSFDDAYTPSQTWLIVATSTRPVSTSMPSMYAPTTTQQGSTSASLPATASIPSSVPTLIVPANSIANQANVGSGTTEDPVKDDTLISLLLSENEYPWLFVVKSSDATSQLFNTFPPLIANALNISQTEIKTYGLMVYQPASWDGSEASLLTQWLAYIPQEQFDTLNAYLKASNSPLFSQPGIQGQLAAQINTAYPLAATTGNDNRGANSGSSRGGGSKKRDIIIGVCVAVGGLLWIALVFWIYKRVKRSNDRAVHKRLSEHMSMFDGANHATYGANDHRLSRAVSVAGSEIDDRPSSFYASPLENDPTYRQYQRERERDSMLNSVRSGASLGHDSPTNYGPSVFGNSWFANPNQAGANYHAARAQNPFEDMVQQSYLSTSGSNGNIQHHVAAQRRSQAVQKGMISNPTLQAHSLEFGKEF